MPKFVTRKSEKEVISMRIPVPVDMLKEVDDKASAVDISRNELMNQMIAYALANMDDTQQQNKSSSASIDAEDDLFSTNCFPKSWPQTLQSGH